MTIVEEVNRSHYGMVTPVFSLIHQYCSIFAVSILALVVDAVHAVAQVRYFAVNEKVDGKFVSCYIVEESLKKIG